MFDVKDVTVSYSGKRGDPGRQHADSQEPRDRVHRPVGLRQDHASAQLQPHERPDQRRDASTGTISYHGHDLNASGRRRGRGAAPHRHGVPAAQPVPEVDLRQRRLRPAPARHEGRPERPGRAGADRTRRCGTRSRTGSRPARCRCRAASSSGCASPGRWPSSPT